MSHAVRFVLLPFTLALLLVAARADAAPFVDVRALVAVGLRDPAPTGISFGCYGDARGSDSCGLSASLNTFVTTSTSLSTSASGGVVIANTTDHIIDGWLTFVTSESAFNPVGPAIGLGIDDAATQGARFVSFITGMGVGDNHACSVGTFGDTGTVFSPTTCGVNAPDFSLGSFSVNLGELSPQGQLFLPYGVTITADFVLPPSSVPAPGSVWTLLAGLIALVGLNRAVTSPRGFSPSHRPQLGQPT